MEFKIITDVENKLFNRREIQGEVHSEIAPKREDIIMLISKKLNSPIENIKVNTIEAKFGSKLFVIVANIYDSEETKNKIERKSKKEKEAEEKRKKQIEEAQGGESEPIPEQQNPDKVVKENEVKE